MASFSTCSTRDFQQRSQNTVTGGGLLRELLPVVLALFTALLAARALLRSGDADCQAVSSECSSWFVWDRCDPLKAGVVSICRKVLGQASNLPPATNILQQRGVFNLKSPSSHCLSGTSNGRKLLPVEVVELQKANFSCRLYQVNLQIRQRDAFAVCWLWVTKQMGGRSRDIFRLIMDIRNWNFVATLAEGSGNAGPISIGST